MHIEQRHVTNINLHDGRARDIVVQKETRGYRLSLMSKEDVVNVYLAPNDVHRLWQEMARAEPREAVKKEPRPGPAQPEERPIPVAVHVAPERPETIVSHWGTFDWLSFN